VENCWVTSLWHVPVLSTNLISAMDNLHQVYKSSVKSITEAFDSSMEIIDKAYEDATKELQKKEQLLQSKQDILDQEVQRFELEKVQYSLTFTDKKKGENR
jgi:hypothetical protein